MKGTAMYETRRALAVGLAVALTLVTTAAPAASSPAAQAPQSQADAQFSDYHFRDGQTLADLRLHYATLGTPHRDAQGSIDNAVLFLHWTGASSQELLTPEYRSAMFGHGAPFDAARYFIVLPDEIGHGQSSKPSDGLRTSFPRYGYGDMVDLQHRLVTETLGITRLHAIIGMSMGCMNAWQWAETFPDAMDGIMPVACFPTSISGRNLLWRRMVVDGIMSDPAWADGNYTSQPPSALAGLEMLRLMIDGVPHLESATSTIEAADEFINDVKQQSAGLDANDFVYALRSSGDFDAEPDLGRIRTKVLVLNFADDEFYRDSLHILEQDMPKVQRARFVVRPVSDGSVGHMTMAHPALWADQVRVFVGWLSKP
jgi:homoserine O-acetyltransferase